MIERAFDFKWKLVENYAAAIVGALFIWLFIEGIVKGQNFELAIAILILAVAPFLVTFLDKRSSSSTSSIHSINSK
jgi:hypothetical protein